MIPADAFLPPEMRAAVIARAAAEAPREACGLVAYDRAGRPVRLYPTVNSAPGADRFEISPAEHFRVIRDTERRGWRIGAVYHSHPRGPARPSPDDLAGGPDEDWISFVAGRRRGRWQIRPYHIAQGAARPLR